MTPDIGSRLQTLISSLSSVVLPAVDKANATAQEQAHLVIASLELIASQIDYLHSYEVVSLRALVALVEELAAISGRPVPAELVEAKAVLAEPLSSTDVLRRAGQLLRSWVVSLIETSDERCADRVREAVFAYETSQNTLDRVVVAETHFDLDVASLPTLAQLIKARAASVA